MLIDISHYQGNVDWNAARNDADGFYIKITEGAGYIDPNWRVYHDATTGKPRGAYHFADLGDPVVEANHFADVYLSGTWDLRPVLDIETAGANAAWIVAFRAQFRKRVGSQAFRVYSGLSYLTGVLNPAGWIDPQTDIWAARYNTTLGWDHPQLVLWQNSSTASEPGFLGSVDTDQFMHGWTPAADQGADMPLAPADANLLLDTPTGSLDSAGHPITLRSAVNYIIQAGTMGGPAMPGGQSYNAMLADIQAKTNALTGSVAVVDKDVKAAAATVVAAIQSEDADVKAAIAAAVHGITTGNVDPVAFASAVAPLLAQADLAAFRTQFAK